jgi:hypothetical protein
LVVDFVVVVVVGGILVVLVEVVLVVVAAEGTGKSGEPREGQFAMLGKNQLVLSCSKEPNVCHIEKLYLLAFFVGSCQ